MKGSVGVCPECKDFVTIKNKMLFFTCPHCHAGVSSNEARTFLEAMCADPSGVNDMLVICIELEQEYGAEVPLEILQKMQKYHPYNEQIAFSVVRMSGYRPDLAKQYLSNFYAARKVVPFAAEFLNNTMQPQNMAQANQFSQYIENKLPAGEQKKYLEQLAELRSSYTGGSSSGEGMRLMYLFYAIGAAVNLAFAVAFIFLPLNFIYNFLIAMAVFAVELFLLYLHNRSYGNRIGIGDRERLLLVIFLSSTIITIGGAIIGALV